MRAGVMVNDIKKDAPIWDLPPCVVLEEDLSSEQAKARGLLKIGAEPNSTRIWYRRLPRSSSTPDQPFTADSKDVQWLCRDFLEITDNEHHGRGESHEPRLTQFDCASTNVDLVQAHIHVHCKPTRGNSGCCVPTGFGFDCTTYSKAAHGHHRSKKQPMGQTAESKKANKVPSSPTLEHVNS
jgi:hypothetical protein